MSKAGDAVALSLSQASAYCGPAPVPADIVWRWNLDPWLIAALVCAGAWAALRREVPARSDAAFLAGLGALAVAFVSPLCALTTALFSARSVHHILLIAMAAPLFALAAPAGGRRAPAIGLWWGLSTAALWAWHVPAVYEATFASPAVYWAMQGALLAAFVLFWRAVSSPGAAPVLAIMAVGAGAGQMGLLAALLTFAPAPLYGPHLVAPAAWGLTPLADQQLAGLVMWVPALVPYGLAAALIGRRVAAQMQA